MNWRRLSVMRPRAWLAARRSWRHRLYLVLAGAVSALSMAPLHFWPALMAGLCLLLWSFDGARRTNRPLRSALMRGFLFGFGFFLAGTFWIAFAFFTRGPGYGALVPIALPGFAALLAIFWGLAGVLYVSIAQRSEWRVLVFAAVITLSEGLRGHLFGGLPWNLPAYTWSAGGLVSQSAAWAGVYGLTFLTVYMLAAPAVAFGSRFRVTRFMPLMAAGAMALVLVCFGALRLSAMPDALQPDVRIRLVEAGLSQAEKWGPEGGEIARDRYLELTGEPGLDAVSHVVWPEGALPIFMLEDGDTLGRIGEALDGGQILIAGVNRRARLESGAAYYNSLAVMRFASGSPRVEGLYDKVRLTPFGEMVPMSWFLSLIGFDEFTRYQFTPGPAASVLELTGAPPMMPLICYEAIFPGFVRDMPDRPAWLLNVSNDAWFGATAGPQQHFNQARYRSIETGLPMVRSASRGVSGVVDAAGRARVEVAPDVTGVTDVSLPVAVQAPPYMIWGDWPAWLASLITIAAVLFQRHIGRRRA
ncbi:apolipoprotein N-acyltransferase [Maricaulis parjimensis]|uniref:apolipoprotein N-acyltransferase n=1 Tax=Maricaulis parjimensis TaxID=144023 RepID=UPI00193A4E1C|nr:apolipoprotein N-acyltransferase [Maricaulis parjimensis]